MGNTTSAFAGFSGQVWMAVDGVTFYPVGETKDATITVAQEAIDATSYESRGWMENIVGLKSWEASLESLYVYGDIGQVNLQAAMFGAQVVSWQFLPQIRAGNLGYTGTGFVNSFEVNIPVDDAVTLSLSITGSGYLQPYQYTASEAVID